MTIYDFAPQAYEAQLSALIGDLCALEDSDRASIERILRRHPKESGLFSKSEIIAGFRYLQERAPLPLPEPEFLERIRMKPVRTISGVAPVTVLTKPYPCPGRCIFCPSDVRMPKSYLSDEPGAQRAAQHRFDPYAQTYSRLQTLHNIGHTVDKVELIILGGTWSSYLEEYQIWFVKRCFEALNEFDGSKNRRPDLGTSAPDFAGLTETVDGRRITRTYNQVVREFSERQESSESAAESAGWADLAAVQRINETASSRGIGLVVETRPDHVSNEEVERIRRLGATKVQVGIQSLSDEVLRMNARGHDVATSRQALRLLRGAGFKIHLHWMPNLYGSDPQADERDFDRLFEDADFRPDELKIYPCSLIESAELMAVYERGEWRPYTHQELLDVLSHCMETTPEYCRLTRVIRDIPGTDIVDGNRLTNFRELAETELAARGVQSREIRGREVRGEAVHGEDLTLRETPYKSAVGREVFLQYVTPENRIAGFLRLSLPDDQVAIEEISTSAMIREVHVYGRLVGIGRRGEGRSQHLGLGRRLAQRAAELAVEGGYKDLAVISSVGTRQYYRSLGFADGVLYQHRRL